MSETRMADDPDAEKIFDSIVFNDLCRMVEKGSASKHECGLLIAEARRAREAEAFWLTASDDYRNISDALKVRADRAEAEVERLRGALIGIIQSADTLGEAEDIARAALRATEEKK